MERDEFIELVYETFADEPDNVLANRIIEAADEYAATEKQAAVQRIQSYLDSYCDDCNRDCSGCEVCFVDVEVLFEPEGEPNG